jgi:hypothetical protein
MAHVLLIGDVPLMTRVVQMVHEPASECTVQMVHEPVGG